MADNTPRLYEGMFLIRQDTAAELNQAEQQVTKILERSEAALEVLYQWDERRLAYPIDGQKRGVYVLTYFRIAPGAITQIEHDCRLSEQVLRTLIIRADHVGDVELDLAKKDAQAAINGAKLRAESDAEPASQETAPPPPPPKNAAGPPPPRTPPPKTPPQNPPKNR
ncbi:MAG: 30S ribosomal protein S6, partial [Phycisphaeraceae bacterium]|nr:30S ribosomal protein S6 [Phycisphaeraceae bacterium]